MRHPRLPAGFSLLELICAMSVIAVLAAILLPTLGAARSTALKAKTRAQFAQWSAALEQFRQEYGYYPELGTDGRLASAADAVKFVRTLSAHNMDGTAVGDTADLNGNARRITFYAFAAGEFTGSGLLCDGFGNTEIGVLVDRNGDGLVKPGDDGSVSPVTGVESGISSAPAETDLPAAGVHAGVLIYSAGRGTGQADLILSWK